MRRSDGGPNDEHVLQAFHEQYLRPRGWFRSVAERAAVDLLGPVPWFTYPATDFLLRIARPEWRVFEYGSGGSTAWWAARSSEVISVEHDTDWARWSAEQAGGAATIAVFPAGTKAPAEAEADLEAFFALGLQPVLTDDAGHNARSGLLWSEHRGYAGAISLRPRGHFDLVVIDGMARSLAAWMAVRWIKPGGLIVFDNSDRETYRPGYSILRDAGFRKIDFWGPGPMNPYEWCTSVFLRDLAALP